MSEENKRVRQKEQKEKEKKGKKKWLILLLLLLLIAVGVAVFYFMYLKDDGQPRIEKELAAKAGLLPSHSKEELQELLNKTVQEGMVNISINPDPIFKDGKSAGTLNIENIPANHYDLQVDITLEDSGEKVYSSGLIEPGHYVDNAKLTKTLKQGDHKAVAVFTAYYPDNQTDVLAKASANIVLHIQK